jgi:hydrogenase expression/formation protein HypD
MGTIAPTQCPLYKKVCNPLNPQGACMVSSEGSCHAYYTNG